MRWSMKCPLKTHLTTILQKQPMKAMTDITTPKQQHCIWAEV